MTVLDFDALIDFVDTEFRHKFRNVVDQITLPIPRRVDQFTCWPGLRVTEPPQGGRPLEATFKSNPSKLRIGEHVYVNLMTVEPKDVISGPEGVIQSLDETSRVVTIQPGYQQAMRFDRRFRLDERLVLDQTLPGSRLSREMPTLALRLLRGEMGDAPRLARIRELLEGCGEPRPVTGAPLAGDDDPVLARLTPAQREAVRRAVESDFAMIQGPPGTGKTFVLGVVVRELVRRGLKVAVCAFTHQAINNVLAECLEHEDIPEVCKLGKRSTWTRAISPRLRLVERPGSYFRAKGTPSVTGFTQHAAFHPVARALANDAEETLPERFDVIVFDESGQLTIPAAVMAMVQADRFVFAGDHRQLPPVVATRRPGEGPSMSVFQHLAERAGHEPVLLDESFRLNETLVRFPSREFYGGAVRSAEPARDRCLEITPEGETAALLDPASPCQLALVRHACRGQESPEEAALIATLVDDAVRAGVPREEIAVIAPHRRQNVKIRELLARLGHAGAHPLVDTVERVQGQERDLVILGMTLSDPDVLSAELDFLFLPNRFNVAITRARRKLIVVASPAFFRALPRPVAMTSRGRSPLLAANVLKRWYFEQRATAVDATDLATRAQRKLASDPSPDHTREEAAAQHD